MCLGLGAFGSCVFGFTYTDLNKLSSSSPTVPNLMLVLTLSPNRYANPRLTRPPYHELWWVGLTRSLLSRS